MVAPVIAARVKAGAGATVDIVPAGDMSRISLDEENPRDVVVVPKAGKDKEGPSRGLVVEVGGEVGGEDDVPSFTFTPSRLSEEQREEGPATAQDKLRQAVMAALRDSSDDPAPLVRLAFDAQSNCGHPNAVVSALEAAQGVKAREVEEICTGEAMQVDNSSTPR